jgi:hypothetical protein
MWWNKWSLGEIKITNIIIWRGFFKIRAAKKHYWIERTKNKKSLELAINSEKNPRELWITPRRL